MRLIDADAMNEKLFYKQVEGKDSLITVESAFEMIKAQPTAYDVDKVVEQLKNLKTDNSCKDCTYKDKCDELQEFYNPNDSVDLCGLTIKELAIEIVKSCGNDK